MSVYHNKYVRLFFLVLFQLTAICTTAQVLEERTASLVVSQDVPDYRPDYHIKKHQDGYFYDWDYWFPEPGIGVLHVTVHMTDHFMIGISPVKGITNKMCGIILGARSNAICIVQAGFDTHGVGQDFLEATCEGVLNQDGPTKFAITINTAKHKIIVEKIGHHGVIIPIIDFDYPQYETFDGIHTIFDSGLRYVSFTGKKHGGRVTDIYFTPFEVLPPKNVTIKDV